MQCAVSIEKSLFWILMIFVELKAKSRSWIHFNTTQVEQVVPKLKSFFTVSHCFNLQHCNFWANVIHELCKAALLHSRGVRWGISSGARWSWGDPFKGLFTYYIKSQMKNNWKKTGGLGALRVSPKLCQQPPGPLKDLKPQLLRRIPRITGDCSGQILATGWIKCHPLCV